MANVNVKPSEYWLIVKMRQWGFLEPENWLYVQIKQVCS